MKVFTILFVGLFLIFNVLIVSQEVRAFFEEGECATCCWYTDKAGPTTCFCHDDNDWCWQFTCPGGEGWEGEVGECRGESNVIACSKQNPDPPPLYLTIEESEMNCKYVEDR